MNRDNPLTRHGFWSAFGPGDVSDTLVRGDSVDIRPVGEIVQEIDTKLRAMGWRTMMNEHQVVGIGPKGEVASAGEPTLPPAGEPTLPPRRSRIMRIKRGPNLPAMKKAGQMPRQSQRHNLFVAAFTEISRRWGGEPRHLRRAMAASRAKRQWKGLPILE